MWIARLERLREHASDSRHVKAPPATEGLRVPSSGGISGRTHSRRHHTRDRSTADRQPGNEPGQISDRGGGRRVEARAAVLTEITAASRNLDGTCKHRAFILLSSVLISTIGS